MGDVVAGINEPELGTLSMEVLDYAERVSSILSRINASMDQLPSCYQGSSCDVLMSRYYALRAQYPTIKNNIKSYSDDFIALIRKMRENDQYLSGLFRGFTSDLRYKSKIDKFDLKKGGF